MTAEQWQSSSDALLMLTALRGKVSDRKVMLFARSCVRRVPGLGQESPYRAELELMQGEAEGEVDTFTFGAAATGSALYSNPRIADSWPDFWTVARAAHQDVYWAAVMALVALDGALPDGGFESMTTLRCIFGNPFPPRVPRLRRVLTATSRAVFGVISNSPLRAEIREEDRLVPHVEVNVQWLTSTVVTLSRQMYDSCDFAPAPILADALQDAGCESEAILGHLRANTRHVRGCWVLDALLGKE